MIDEVILMTKDFDEKRELVKELLNNELIVFIRENKIVGDNKLKKIILQEFVLKEAPADPTLADLNNKQLLAVLKAFEEAKKGFENVFEDNPDKNSFKMEDSKPASTKPLQVSYSFGPEPAEMVKLLKPDTEIKDIAAESPKNLDSVSNFFRLL